jgi:hypothetical protein
MVTKLCIPIANAANVTREYKNEPLGLAVAKNPVIAKSKSTKNSIDNALTALGHIFSGARIGFVILAPMVTPLKYPKIASRSTAA